MTWFSYWLFVGYIPNLSLYYDSMLKFFCCTSIALNFSAILLFWLIFGQKFCGIFCLRNLNKLLEKLKLLCGILHWTICTHVFNDYSNALERVRIEKSTIEF